MIGIYKITNPNGKVYIGQTINHKTRFKNYSVLSCKGQPILYNSLLKYGVDNHKFEFIQECSKNELYKLERHFQELYNCIGKNGLNCQLVRTDSTKIEYSQDLKDKFSKIRKGVKKSEEHKSKISESLKGKKRPKDVIEKIRKSLIGKKRPEDVVEKIAKKLRGKKMSEEQKTKMKIIANNRPTNYYDYLKKATQND